MITGTSLPGNRHDLQGHKKATVKKRDNAIFATNP
jgi:hypothetical protein